MKEAKLTARLLELIELRLTDKSFNENSARMLKTQANYTGLRLFVRSD